jgi:hypothetical protein
MNIDKKLYIHIGTHKTGSSAIQASIQCNSTFLKRNDFSFLKYSLTHHPHILHSIDCENQTRLKEEKTNLENEISMISENNIILSCEEYFGDLSKSYSDAHSMAYKLSFVTKSYQKKIIIYLRRQDEFIESSYAQYIKEGASFSFCDFIKHDINNYQFNWFKLIGFYIDIFGKENVSIRPYEKKQLFEGDVVKDFYKIIGIDSLELLKKHKYSNYGFTRSALEIARIYNKTYKTNNTKKMNLSNILQTRMHKNKFGEFNFFLYQERKKLLEYYKESNLKVAVEYLHQPQDMLYYEPINKYKDLHTRKNGLIFNDIINFYPILKYIVKSKILTFFKKI